MMPLSEAEGLRLIELIDDYRDALAIQFLGDEREKLDAYINSLIERPPEKPLCVVCGLPILQVAVGTPLGWMHPDCARD